MDPTPQQLFDLARSALMAGDAATATQHARQLVRLAPGAWQALHLLAVSEREAGRLAEARTHFKAALDLAPDNGDIHFNHALNLEAQGALAEAIQHYRRATELRPGHVQTWLNLSMAEHAAGSPSAARAAVEAAVRARPEHARAWTMAGFARHADGDGDGAEAALRRATALAPADAQAARALAELEADRGGDALALFERAAALDPADGQTALALAVSRHAAGEAEAALVEIARIAEAAPGWVLPHLAAAKLLIAEGRLDAAKAVFVEALERRPRDLDLWLAWLQTLAKLEDHAGVLAAATAAQAQLGEQPVLSGFAAAALDETGQHAEAAAMLQRLDATGGQAFAEARVRNLLRTGRIDAAARRAEAAVVRPDGQTLWAYLATAWRMCGDPRWGWLEQPGFVQAIDLEDGAAIAAAVAPVLRRLHTARAAPLGQTIRGGSQTDGRLFLRREPEIQRLVAALQRAVQAYAAALPPADPRHPLLSGPRAPVRFSGSWSVRLKPGGLHVNHVHPDGWLSSAFYVDLPERELGPGTQGWLAIGEPPAELKLDLEPYALIEPRPGRLALFPSYTWHGTRPFSSGERLTAAFDVTAG